MVNSPGLAQVAECCDFIQERPRCCQELGSLRHNKPLKENPLSSFQGFFCCCCCYLVDSEGIKAYSTGLILADKSFCKDLCVEQIELDILYSTTLTAR